jgi:hypothetical protein
MNQFEISNEHYKLEQLHYWLTYGIYSGVILFTAIFFPLVFALPVIGLVILGFSAYIIKSLVQLGRKGWIVGYAILISFPLLLAILLSDSEIIGSAVWFMPLCAFYFYCWILRQSVTEWLSDIGDEKAFELRDKHEEQVKKMMDNFHKDSF